MNSQALISLLDLQPHPLEGGYFKRIYEAQTQIDTKNGPRLMATSIHYLLTKESPIGFFHKNTSDIVHYFQLGAPILFHLISPEGEYRTHTLGSNLNVGEILHLTVPGGYWKASELLCGDFGLISEVVVPGFDYGDNTLATTADLAAINSQNLKHLIKAPAA